MSERPEAIPISDPQLLKGLSHPLRARLMYTLVARGTARATDLAVELDAPVNQVSQHLRYLAKYGIIEEAPEQAKDKRERVWRMASTKGLAPDPAAIAMPAYKEAARRSAHHILDSYLTDARPGFHRSHDVTVYLSPAEVEQFADDLLDLLFRWNQRGQENSAADPDTERMTYLANFFIQPLPLD